MQARQMLSQLIENDGIRDPMLDEPVAGSTAPPASNAPQAPVDTHRRPQKWVVGSLAGMSLDDLYPDKGVLVIVELPGDSFLNKPSRRIGIASPGRSSVSDPIGSVVDIQVDTQGRGYRRLGQGKVVGFAPLTSDGARAQKVRALYHFD